MARKSVPAVSSVAAVESVEAALAAAVVEVPETVSDAPTSVVEAPSSVRALAGDSYLTIAERYGLRARDLHSLNDAAPVREGSLVRLL